MTDPLPVPGDNLFGICAAIGADFGFDPLWLRLAFGLGLLVNLEAVVGAYLVLGVIVLASRLLAPVPKRVVPAEVVMPVAANDGAVTLDRAA